MATFPYADYTPEILGIARQNNVQWDIGLDMLLNNIQDAYVENDPYFYHGADHLDYKKLHDTYPGCWDGAVRADITNGFKTWYRANMKNIIPLWQAQNIDAVRKYCAENAPEYE